MATNQNNDGFEDLLKMLAWKRHEQPPHGYFDNFSANITDRIDAEKHVPAWWQKYMWLIDPKPLYEGAFGLTVCGALFFGLFFQAAPQAGQPQIRIQELADTWPQIERSSFKSASHTRGLTLHRDTSSITPVINAEPYDSVWDSEGPNISKVSFNGF